MYLSKSVWAWWPNKPCIRFPSWPLYLTVPRTNKKLNLRGAMDDLWLRPTFHVLVFVHDPHSSLDVLFPHKTFVKRQVMAYSVLLIMSSSVYVSATHIFPMQHWKYKRLSHRTRVVTGMETLCNQKTIIHIPSMWLRFSWSTQTCE